MSKDKGSKKTNISADSGNIANIDASKAEILKKIEVVLAAEGEALEKAADEIAPEFDYEKEAAELAAEETPDATEAADEAADATVAFPDEADSAAEPEVHGDLADFKPLPHAEVSPSHYPKERKAPTTGFGRLFLRDRHQKTLGVTLLLLVGVLGWWTYDYVIPLWQSEMIEAMIGGKYVEIRVLPGTVEETLAYNDIEYDEDDIIKPALGEKIDPAEMLESGKTITVDYVEYECVDKTEKVKAEHYVKLDPTVESGVEKFTDGNDGKGVFTYKTKYVNGEKKGTERELKEWIVEPHDTMHILGTKRTGHKGRYKITKTFTANCSAYWMGDNCIGASGGRCVYGTVAVDCSKYPYGTMFWIEGYGFAVANDCGSSIKGDKIDLWMDSYAESCSWGRQHMTTYVLEEE